MHVCLRLTQARPPCAVRAPSKHVSVAAIPSTPPVRCEGTEQARKRCAATHWVDAGARACVSKMTRAHVAPFDAVDAMIASIEVDMKSCCGVGCVAAVVRKLLVPVS